MRVATEMAGRALPDIRAGFDRLVGPGTVARHGRAPGHKLKPVDFVAQRVDIGVRYGPGSWPGLMADKLMDEEDHPACSPQLLREHWRLQKPSDLGRETLIHDLSMDGHAGFPTWDAWPQKAGVKDVSTSRGMKINNSAAVLQAAIEGQGVALDRCAMARDDLATGRLVRLFPEVTFASSLAYYVVYRAECSDLPRLVAFRDWLVKRRRGSYGYASSRRA